MTCIPEFKCVERVSHTALYFACDEKNNCEVDDSVQVCAVTESEACKQDLDFNASQTREEQIAMLRAYHDSCDDGNPATIDVCQVNKCRHYPEDPEVGCNICTKDADCDDDDEDKVSWCDAGTCHSTDRWGDACTEVEWWSWCFRDMHCDDADPGTLDWCDWGQCMHLRRGSRGDVCEPEPECVRNSDCRDGDRSTKNWCHEGSCHSVQKDDPLCVPTGQSCWRNRDCDAQLPVPAVQWCLEGECRAADLKWQDQCVEGTSVGIRP